MNAMPPALSAQQSVLRQKILLLTPVDYPCWCAASYYLLL